MNFYISDTHFSHANCLAFDNRPFKTVYEMDAEMIRRWNAVVSNDDHVYILGDFHWGKEPDWIKVLEQLKGQKTLIKGNHDIDPQKSRKYFADVKDYKVIDDNERKIVLSHYPIVCYRNHFYGWYHLYGHVHTSFEFNMMEHDKYLMEELYTKPCEMYNIGCMLPYMDYTPRTLDQIIEGYKACKQDIKDFINGIR